MNFTIEQGGVRAGPHWRRAFFWWLPTWRRQHTMRMSFHAGQRTGGKAWGLARLSLSWKPAHQHSDRFLFDAGPDFARVYPGYSYRKGERHDGVGEPLQVVSGEEVTMMIWPEPDAMHYYAEAGEEWIEWTVPHEKPLPQWMPFLPLFSHADNGSRQPSAPARVSITARKPGEVLRHALTYVVLAALIAVLLTAIL